MSARKILYSPGFGAGWTTWASRDEVRELMLTYRPIIDFLEAGNKFTREDIGESRADLKPTHPLLVALCDEAKDKFGEDYLYVGGAMDLRVKTVSGRVRIHEYDGAESVEEEGEYEGWL